jgi:hypothetical protein
MRSLHSLPLIAALAVNVAHAQTAAPLSSVQAIDPSAYNLAVGVLSAWDQGPVAPLADTASGATISHNASQTPPYTLTMSPQTFGTYTGPQPGIAVQTNNLSYTSWGVWSTNALSTNGIFSFAAGISTPQNQIPKKGVMNYSGNVIFDSILGGGITCLNCAGTIGISLDFGKGTSSSNTTLGAGSITGSLSGSGSLNGGTYQQNITGTLSGTNGGSLAGGLAGKVYGPQARETGGSFVASGVNTVGVYGVIGSFGASVIKR